MNMGLEQSFNDWGQVIAGEGVRKGHALALIKQLASRFGPLPDATKAEINDAQISPIDIWLVRVLRAKTLSGVFKD
jgi:hypothetical protein